MPKVSQEHLDARRDEILDAACLCFARKGFHETTIADIREASGLSTGAIYGHFESKDAIVRAAADRALERLEAMVEIAREEPDPRHGLRRLYEAVTACATAPGEGGLESSRLEVRLRAAAIHDPDLRALVQRWYRTLIPEIAELVERIRADEGRPRDPPAERIARAIVAAMEGSLVQRVIDEEADLDLAETVVGWIAGEPPT